ncbi:MULTISPECIES: class I SAM-dependent rRNA methyltransferase [Pontibacillus]|uniref:Class I SAM-dependent rRNA methyltransferase n=1 Tax=Pontibacillus chungwhensis TaxID=265426 RepID=A0ABY8V3R7_9BACI|nr:MULTISPECIES: class I SAM-dependent rRNA methyltransferase [Pontibacillus]MCD5325668.1 class I SAM-dependent rRNA methyltransferase [Pontibacillus sp. HN14]WIG00279.1 class I SAM-dependent rRNA methyltransferase [Pontibacillus chungwhensis]
MKNEIKVKVRNDYAKKMKDGFPLIEKEALINADILSEEGQTLHLIDERGRFIGRGYYGEQNKGYGWVVTRQQDESMDQSFFEKKIGTALQKRSGFFKDESTTAFRIFNGEGDGIGGLTIDYYEAFYVLSWYSEGIYAFKNQILKALQNLVEYKGIYEKKRFNTGGKYIDDDDFVTGERGEFPMLVKENGVQFSVHLNEGPMTGVFLDQRDVRKAIRDRYAEGKTVLNTFSYTGAFSVFAALGGAQKTTSVDLANRSYPKTVEQFSINGIDYEAHDIKVMDVFEYFKYAVKKQLTFDLVVLDPPSFARSKKHRFSAAKDYKDLLKQAIAITEKNGVIIASTNYSGYGMGKFKGFVEKAFKETGHRYKIEEQYTLPSDFVTTKEYKAGDYLKVVFIKKL